MTESMDKKVPIPSRTAEASHYMTLTILWQIVVIALVAITFTAVFLSLYAALNNLIWLSNDFMEANRWMIPAGVLIFSLLVGLCQRYLHAPTVIHGGFVESLKGEGEQTDYRTFPGALLSALFSLLSGASIGPEGAVAVLVGDISCFLRKKLKIGDASADTALGFDVAALASAFNGIIGNVLFTGIFATEFQVGGKNALRFLTWNLLAGSIGFLFYMYLGLPSFARMIPFSPLAELRFVYVLYAIALGILGGLLAIFTGVSMQGIETVMENAFKDNALLRILAAGSVIAVVGYFIPNLLFSGEAQIHAIIAQPAQIGVAMLVLMAVLEILLLALSFKSGYLGGPIFPILFSSTMIGLALSLVLPEVPIAIFVSCIEVAAITLALGVPLTAILLVAVVGSSDPYMVVLLVISAITAMILAAEARRMRRLQR
jgi:H+/Cl- antiporter ClcA